MERRNCEWELTRDRKRKVSPLNGMKETYCCCLSFVTATTAINMSFPVLFRMWNPGPIDNCTVIEAALATCAAPGIIAGVNIKGQAGLYTRYIGADLRWNNPVMSVLDEATEEFPGRGKMVVSIGTGKEGVIAIEHRKPTQLTETLKKIARDCEETSERASKHCDTMGWKYFRLNVDQGVQGLAWKEWDKHGSGIRAHTASYLKKIAAKEKLGLLMENIRPMIEPPPTYSTSSVYQQVRAQESVRGPQDSAKPARSELIIIPSESRPTTEAPVVLKKHPGGTRGLGTTILPLSS